MLIMEDPSKELTCVKATLKRRIRTLKKALHKAEMHLAECNDWHSLKHAAELIQANLYRLKKGDVSLEVQDWENDQPVTLSLDSRLKPHEEIAKRFRKAKKLEKGLPYAINQLSQIKQSLDQWQNCLLELETLEDLAAFKEKYDIYPQKQISKESKEPKKPYIEYFSKTGIPIWVGRSASMNDQLTFRYARGKDLWLHVADHPGSHVVIRHESPDEETLQQALQLALHHSKARRFKEGEVVLTHVKHVRRIGKQKGKVQIAEEKRFFIRTI